MRDSSVFWFVVIVCLVLLVSYGFASAYAEHDYFSPSAFWDKSPNVCVVDIPRTDLFFTLRAVDSWDKALVDYTNSTDWRYTIYVTDEGDIGGCNIIVRLTDSMHYVAEDGTVPVGITDCGRISNVCLIYVDTSYLNGKLVYDTIVHEMGHAIGLGHRLPYTASGFPAVFISNDIMMPVAKDGNLEISKESLDALIFFKENQINQNYTIPHYDSWDYNE